MVNLLTFQNGYAVEQKRRRSYSLLFEHPVFFGEAVEMVLRTHPAIFYSPEDLRQVLQQQRRPIMSSLVSSVILDFGRVEGRLMRKAIRSLSKMELLTALTIHVPRADLVKGIELPTKSTRGGMYPAHHHFFASLVGMEVIDRGAEEAGKRKRRREVEDEVAIVRINEALALLGPARDYVWSDPEVWRLGYEKIWLQIRQLQRHLVEVDKWWTTTPADRLRSFNRGLRERV